MTIDRPIYPVSIVPRHPDTSHLCSETKSDHVFNINASGPEMQEQDVTYCISIQQSKRLNAWVVVCAVGVWIRGLGCGRYGAARVEGHGVSNSQEAKESIRWL